MYLNTPVSPIYSKTNIDIKYCSFYGYLIALYTSYENTNVFAANIREETLQSADIQSVTDYRAFLMPCCLSLLFDEALRTIPQIMFNGVNIKYLT